MAAPSSVPRAPRQGAAVAAASPPPRAGRRRSTRASAAQPLPVALGVKTVTRRQTTDTGTMATPWRLIVPPSGVDAHWRLFRATPERLDKLGVSDLLPVLADVSPEVNKGRWDYQRFHNPGWSFEVKGQDGQDSAEGKALLDEFLAVLGLRHGSPDVVFNRLFYGGWLRGAYFCELVLDADYVAQDLATPDPLSVAFKTFPDPVLGQVDHLGQVQGGRFIDLHLVPTIGYAPIDAAPGSNYGAPIPSAAIFTALFIQGVMADLRLVIQQQGYEHVDISVVQEILSQQAPRDVQDDPQKMLDWTAAQLSSIATLYTSLEPDDAYVHTDSILVNKSEGAANVDAIGGISELLSVLERMALRALKSMPLLMGITDGVSEANANRQWEIHLTGVSAGQHLVEQLLERLFTFLCRARGLLVTVKWRFAQVRGAEEERDQRILQIKILNYTALYLMGAITLDEMAQATAGHAAILPAPIAVPKAFAPVGAGNGPAGDAAGTQGGSTPTPAPEDAPADAGNSQMEQWTRLWQAFMDFGAAQAPNTNGHAAVAA